MRWVGGRALHECETFHPFGFDLCHKYILYLYLYCIGIFACATDVRGRYAIPPCVCQLRNPLHAMMGAITVLESGDADEADTRWQVPLCRFCVFDLI
jgi:hypothetical protein